MDSDGPTSIYDRQIKKWKEINLDGDGSTPNYLIQSGGLMNLLSKGEYVDFPHGVGRSPVISDGLGKISIIGVLDLDADVDVVFTSNDETATIKSGEYCRIRFKATYPSEAEKKSDIKLTGLEAECARLDDEPNNRELYRKFISQLNSFERPNPTNTLM